MTILQNLDVPLFPTRNKRVTQPNSGDVSLKKLEEIRRLPPSENKEALTRAIADARQRKMGRTEREAQIVSFVWGNAPEGNQGTIETVRENLKLTA